MPDPQRHAAWRRHTLIMTLAVLAGAAFAFPSGSEWISATIRAQEIGQYNERIEGVDAAERRSLLEDARQYNWELRSSPLSDPYIANEAGNFTSHDIADYNGQLAIDETSPMARLRMPSVGVDLPIYHGTDPRTLERGVGHLLGSSLPVGGPGSHAVLTAHNGFTGAEMFDDLHSAAVGDTFTISAMGEVREYSVDDIRVVEPRDIEALRQVPGREYVTLVTCTPRYINSDRLLVRGTLTDIYSDPAGDTTDPSLEPGDPWWILLLLCPPAAVAGLLWLQHVRSPPSHRALSEADARG